MQQFEDDDEDSDATLTPSSKQNFKRVASRRTKEEGRAAAVSDMAMETVAVEKSPARPAQGPADGGWTKAPACQYIPIAAGHGKVKAYTPVSEPAKPARTVESSEGSHSSFVLSNVFAGCPLTVLCAASWKCQTAGQEVRVAWHT